MSFNTLNGKMNDMKFKWKLASLTSLGIFVFLLWYISVHQRRKSDDGVILMMTPEEEIVILKAQLRAALDSRARSSEANLPTIYAITPTFTRPVQKAELTRLSQTFRLVPNFHWIVVEDAPAKTPLVGNLLSRSLLNFTHLSAETPGKWKFVNNRPNWKKPRGVEQRNAALDWLRETRTMHDHGVVYFADDDNTYDTQVFEEMRDAHGVAVWPVGLVGGLMVEKCIVDSTTGRVTGWNSAWRPERPFPLDMAAFAINLRLLLAQPKARFSFDVERGYQESAILRYVTKVEEMEPRADNCTKVYVWHTRTEAPVLKDEGILHKLGKPPSDRGFEV